jgi:hypothetical protein
MPEVRTRSNVKMRVAASLAACGEFAIALGVVFGVLSGTRYILLKSLHLPISDDVIYVAYLIGLITCLWYFARRFNFYFDKWVGK